MAADGEGGKNGYSWLEFNEWARDIKERTNKRPGVRAIRTWWECNAERVWPDPSSRPTYDLAKRHAKGLRTKHAIREYFREYRARRGRGRASTQTTSRKAKSSQDDDVSSIGNDDDDGHASSDDGGCSGHVDGAGQAGPSQADVRPSQADDSEQRNAAETLLTALRKRPQRIRCMPSRFQSAGTIAQSPSSSCSSGRQRNDGGGESTCSEGETAVKAQPPHNSAGGAAHRRHQGPCSLGGAAILGQTTVSGRRPVLHMQPTGSAERQGRFLARQSGAPTSYFGMQHQASFCTTAVRQPTAGSDDLVTLLQILANGGGPALQVRTAAQHQLLAEPRPPSSLHVLASAEAATLLALCRSTDIGLGGLTASTKALGQPSGLFQQIPGAKNPLPAPDVNLLSARRGSDNRPGPPSGATVAAPAVNGDTPSQLQQPRQPLAHLPGPQCVSMFGYEEVLNFSHAIGDLHVIRGPDAAAAASPVTAVNGIRLPAAVQKPPADSKNISEPLQRKTPNNRKRSDRPDEGEQPHLKRAADMRAVGLGEEQGIAGRDDAPAPYYAFIRALTPYHVGNRASAFKATDLASARRMSGGGGVTAKARTPFPQHKGPLTGQDAEPPLGELLDGLSSDPSSTLRLGSIMRSGLGACVGQDFGFGYMHHDAEHAGWHSTPAGIVASGLASMAGPDAGRVDGLAGGVIRAAAAGEWVDSGLPTGGAVYTAEQQPMPPQTICQDVLIHVKREAKDSEPGIMWVPLEDTSGGSANRYLYNRVLEPQEVLPFAEMQPTVMPYPLRAVASAYPCQQHELYAVPPPLPPPPGLQQYAPYSSGPFMPVGASLLQPPPPDATVFLPWQQHADGTGTPFVGLDTNCYMPEPYAPYYGYPMYDGYGGFPHAAAICIQQQQQAGAGGGSYPRR